jgi:hypothetical protein
LASTIGLSWESFLRGIPGAIHSWRDRGEPFLKERRDLLEVQVFSKLWYLAQILLLSQALAMRVIDLGSSFLWVGFHERLP